MSNINNVHPDKKYSLGIKNWAILFVLFFAVFSNLNSQVSTGIMADTIVICPGEIALIEASDMIDPVWTGDSYFNVNDSTIKAFPQKTSVYKVEYYTFRKNLALNGGFEGVNLSGTNAQLDAGLVSGWNTTATDNLIEIWRSGFQGHPSYSGALFAELNATQSSALYQDLQTIPGETVKWGFAHRGRVKTDNMQLSAGPPGGPYTLIGSFTDTKTQWGYYSGVYEVPAGQTNTRFKFSSTDPGSLGNFIDAATFDALIKHEDSVVVMLACKTDLGVTKNDGRDDYTPGTTTQYTIVVKNYGPSNVVGAKVIDPPPIGILNGAISWDAVVSGNAVSGVSGSQVGALNDEVNIPVGDSIIYSVNIAIPVNYKGDLINTVTIASDLDTNATNNIATDIDKNGLCSGATISSFAEQFNTGVKINPGQNDPNWTVQWINDPTHYTYPAQDYAISKNNTVIPAMGMNKAAGVWASASYPNYLWVSYPWTGTGNGPGKHEDADGDGVLNEYIGKTAVQGGQGDAVLLKYSKTFEMTAAQVAASEISFSIAADNFIEDIIVNGVSHGPKALGSFSLIPHTITNDFQIGTNTIEIILNSGPGYAGIMIANSTIKAVDSVSLIITDPPLVCAPALVDITDSLWTVGSINANVLTYFRDEAATLPFTTPEIADSGAYYIVATSPIGCSDTAKINVNEHPNPDVVLMNDTNFCAGESVTIDAGLFDTWSWNVGNETGQTITVDSTYNYKVVVTNIFGCSDSDSVMITVTPLPDVTLRGDTTFCEGGSAILDVGNFVNLMINWGGGENSQAITVDSTGVYKLTVTTTFGCSDSDSVNITVNPLPIVDLGNDVTVCPRKEVTLDAGSPGATYLWSTTEHTKTIVVDKIGLYEVTVTDKNGCVATGEMELLNYDEPNVELGNDTMVCSPEVVELDPGFWNTYLWSDGSMDYSFTASETDTIWVEVSDHNFCYGRDSIIIQVIAPPIVDIRNDTSICDGDSLILNAQNEGIDFYWNTNETTQKIDIKTAGMYEVEVTNEHGCTGSDFMQLFILELPIVDIGRDTILCEPESITIDAGKWASYSWSQMDTSRTLVMDTSGTLIVNIIDKYGCAGSDEIIVKVNPLPIVDLGNDTTICINETAMLDAGNPASNYTWSYTWSYTWNTGETTQQVNKAAGFYKVNVYDDYRCFNEDSITINLELIPDPYPEKQFEICEGENIDLQPDNGYELYDITWPNLSTTSLLNVDDAGDYYSTVSGEYCAETFKLTVAKIDTPDISILNLSGRNTACFDYETVPLKILNDNHERYTYEWSTGETEAKIKVSEAGQYYVTANNGFCDATKQIELIGFCPGILYIPNAFSPNDDGKNDVFTPAFSGEITNYELVVLNRWGDLIYRTNNLHEGWDGTYKGGACQIDVYVYKITYDYFEELESEQTNQRVGTVTLIR